MVDNRNRMPLTVGAWLREHTRPDSVVALSAIGGIAWISERRVLDLEGLVTPEVVPYKHPGQRLVFLEKTEPDYLAIFPQWYPDLAARTDLFQEVYRVTIRRVTAGPDTMVVYRTPWAKR